MKEGPAVLSTARCRRCWPRQACACTTATCARPVSVAPATQNVTTGHRPARHSGWLMCAAPSRPWPPCPDGLRQTLCWRCRQCCQCGAEPESVIMSVMCMAMPAAGRPGVTLLYDINSYLSSYMNERVRGPWRGRWGATRAVRVWDSYVGSYINIKNPFVIRLRLRSLTNFNPKSSCYQY